MMINLFCYCENYVLFVLFWHMIWVQRRSLDLVQLKSIWQSKSRRVYKFGYTSRCTDSLCSQNLEKIVPCSCSQLSQKTHPKWLCLVFNVLIKIDFVVDAVRYQLTMIYNMLKFLKNLKINKKYVVDLKDTEDKIF